MLALLLALASPLRAGDATKGKALFATQCAFCHGAEGAGDGPDAGKFYWAPANLKEGNFKFRSTRAGNVPTDADLERTIKKGLFGSAMLPQDHLKDAEIKDIIAYVKTLSPKFKEAPTPVKVEKPADLERLAAGAADMYVKAGCAQCHGGGGRGSGPSAGQLTVNGRPVKPADLTRRPFKGGDSPEDIYLRLAGGMDGTPMPSFSDALDPVQIWTLAVQVMKFEKKGAPPAPSDDEKIARELVKQKQPGRK